MKRVIDGVAYNTETAEKIAVSETYMKRQRAIWPRARGRRLAPIPGEIVSASGEGRLAEVFGCCVNRGGGNLRHTCAKITAFPRLIQYGPRFDTRLA
jgi:hypothetical protein